MLRCTSTPSSWVSLPAGAVDELLCLEKKLGNIHLSHLIERRVQGAGRPNGDIETLLPLQAKHPGNFPSWPIWLFYGLPELILVVLSICFGCAARTVGA